MDGLQSILNDQPSAAGQFGQQVQNLVAHAIGPGADDQANHLGMRNGLFVSPPKPVDGPIGVGAGLEVGQELVCMAAFGQAANSQFDLVGDGSQPPDRRLGLKLSGSQKAHPKVPSVPSRLGHPQPASTLIFQTLAPNFFRQKKLRLWYTSPADRQSAGCAS